jgi:hypothetical protein
VGVAVVAVAVVADSPVSLVGVAVVAVAVVAAGSPVDVAEEAEKNSKDKPAADRSCSVVSLPMAPTYMLRCVLRVSFQRRSECLFVSGRFATEHACMYQQCGVVVFRTDLYPGLGKLKLAL